MIHELLHLTRPLFVLDTETTGTDVKNDRIIELGFQQWTSEGMVKEWRSLINPGVHIPEDVSKIHGIADDDFKKCRTCGVKIGNHHTDHDFDSWPTFKELAASFAKGFSNCDYAGKNVRFDLRILAHEMRRAGVNWTFIGAKVICAERIEQLAVPRSLSHLHEKYTGKKHDGAHGALSDVRASTTVIVHQLQAYASLPRTVEALHEAQWPDEWLDHDGSFKIVNGVATCQFGKHRGKPMREIEPSYWDWILREKFPEDVKQLARNAKLGVFPEA